MLTDEDQGSSERNGAIAKKGDKALASIAILVIVVAVVLLLAVHLGTFARGFAWSAIAADAVVAGYSIWQIARR